MLTPFGSTSAFKNRATDLEKHSLPSLDLRQSTAPGQEMFFLIRLMEQTEVGPDMNWIPTALHPWGLGLVLQTVAFTTVNVRCTLTVESTLPALISRRGGCLAAHFATTSSNFAVRPVGFAQVRG